MILIILCSMRLIEPSYAYSSLVVNYYVSLVVIGIA